MASKLKANPRPRTGTHGSRSLRKQSLIPAVIYGHGLANENVALPVHEVELAVKHGERLLELDVSGAIQNVLIKEVQWDTYGVDVIHVDLTRVNLDERVEVTVPIILKGTPVGLIEGGSLQQVSAEVDLECPVVAIPESLSVQVNALKVDDVITMADLKLPEGSVLKSDAATIVCTVVIIAEEVAAPAGEEGAAAEPEVIGAKKEEEEGEEEEGKKKE
ncbi:MAG: 50S ribosomal protein L25 [Planctomycetaceae bacterium]|nr:50S ribosomal protein L25 [Planctomycetaceae bacterium]